MKTRIYCKTIAKGQQAFYLVADNKEYYLFTQNYRVSVKEFFSSGISIQESMNYTNAHSTAVRNTLDKLSKTKNSCPNNAIPAVWRKRRIGSYA